MTTLIETSRKTAFKIAGELGYRGPEALEFLRSKAGVKSLKDIEPGGWSALATQLRRLVVPSDKPENVSAAQWRAVWAIRRKLRINEKQFIGIVKHVTKLDHYQFLDCDNCRKLITGMNKIAAGQKKN